MKGKREEKKEAVRQKILDVSLELFESHGYEAVSVNQIVKAAGIAKGTFFNYFPKKADLIADWYKQRATASLDKARASRQDSFSDALFDLAQQSTAIIDDSNTVWRAKIIHVIDTPSIQQIEQASDNQLRVYVAELISTYNVETKVSPEEFAELFASLITGTIREWVNNGQKEDLPAKLKHTITLFLKCAT
ncbi:TetR/AcrR family transcriptional regulator [Kangiella sediminilitoris]|uniref:HTH tetR-type domain-containing protein n=1 Tax=Kangiella sediminilitoris TaxID=1144748 RepID=A0A1B3BAH9_9GAMM|nr:TetR/AcrR family transcriptional regulator [Kangiella sediminilitoris]AOE49812.1 hypothetical protein KS2013_1092 [Kangiella sediminilitoris]